MAEPKVRFKRDDGSNYPEWEEYSISDLFSKIGTKNKNGKNTNVITNSAEFGLIPQRDYFDKDIAVEGRTDNYTVIQTGDFVYNPRKSSYAPMGPFNCYGLEEDGIVSPLYSCLRPKGILNPDYLLWYFQTDKWYGYVNDHGAQNGARHDRVGMTDSILMGIPVTAPCDEEQQKIADFLSSVDEVITASEQEVANLETQKKAVMKKIFSQEVRFKREDGTGFPEWEEMRIGDICKTYSGGTPKAGNEEYYGGSIPFIRSGEIHSDSTELFLSEQGLKSSSAKMVHVGDIIMALYGATSGEIDISKIEGAINQAILCVKPIEGFDRKFIVEIFRNNKDGILKTYLQGGQGNLSAQIVQDLSFDFPCLEEQRLIADFLFNFDEVIAMAMKELELWKELKKGLLQQLFI